MGKAGKKRSKARQDIKAKLKNEEHKAEQERRES
jgi:hypothetical protein